MAGTTAASSQKSHRKRKAGKKAEKRKTAEQKKKGVLEDAQARRQNPRAFAFQSAGKAKAQRARTAEKEQRRLHGKAKGGTPEHGTARLSAAMWPTHLPVYVQIHHTQCCCVCNSCSAIASPGDGQEARAGQGEAPHGILNGR